MNLPPLPRPASESASPMDNAAYFGYTDWQMRAYAAEAVRVALEQAARVVEPSQGTEPRDIRADGYEMLQDLAAKVRALIPKD